MAVAVVAVRRRLHDARLDNVLGVLTAFLAYLPAELLHASGVVAVVTCGLTLAQLSARLGSARTRVQSTGFWTLSTFMLNGALFVLIGFELHAVVEGQTARAIWAAVGATGLIALTVIATRLLCTNGMIHIIQALERQPAQRLQRVAFRARLPTQWAGFRGAVSLAAALAVPTTTAQGVPLEGRGTVLLVTFGVIVVLLAVQGLTLPVIIRFSRVEHDAAEDHEQRLGEITATTAAAAVLTRRAAELDVPAAVVSKVRDAYQATLHRQHVEEALAAEEITDSEAHAEKRRVLGEADAERALLLALLEDKREAIALLRDEQTIDDSVMRRLQTSLDVEEVRLLGVERDQ